MTDLTRFTIIAVGIWLLAQTNNLLSGDHLVDACTEAVRSGHRD